MWVLKLSGVQRMREREKGEGRSCRVEKSYEGKQKRKEGRKKKTRALPAVPLFRLET